MKSCVDTTSVPGIAKLVYRRSELLHRAALGCWGRAASRYARTHNLSHPLHEPGMRERTTTAWPVRMSGL